MASQPNPVKQETLKEKHLKQGSTIQCIRSDAKLPLAVKLTCSEFTWNCPEVQQPDYGKLVISYMPVRRVMETKSLKFYLQTYRYKNAFNEELVHRIALDILYYAQPLWLEVVLEQNSRGGISNTSSIQWDSRIPRDKESWEKLNYVPKRTFQGGWSMEK